MPERYKNIKFGSLDEYITPDKFRTIGDDMRHIPPGITEFAVEIHMKYKLKSKLSFKTPWDGIIYGCARNKRALKEKLGLMMWRISMQHFRAAIPMQREL